MQIQNPAGASLGISGTLVFKDKDGNVLKTTEMRGSIPLADLGVRVEEAQQIINQQQKDADHGTDLCE